MAKCAASSEREKRTTKQRDNCIYFVNNNHFAVQLENLLAVLQMRHRSVRNYISFQESKSSETKPALPASLMRTASRQGHSVRKCSHHWHRCCSLMTLIVISLILKMIKMFLEFPCD